MVVEQGPGIAEGACFAQQRSEAPDKIMAILVIFEDVGLCDTANDDVLKQTGDIDTGLTWHEKKISAFVNLSRTSPWSSPKRNHRSQFETR